MNHREIRIFTDILANSRFRHARIRYKYLSVKQKDTLERRGSIFVILKSEITVSLEIG